MQEQTTEKPKTWIELKALSAVEILDLLENGYRFQQHNGKTVLVLDEGSSWKGTHAWNYRQT